MTRTRGATIVFAALVAAAAFPGAARAECYLENVASPQEIAGGWTIHEDRRIVKQVDSAPYEQGGARELVCRPRNDDASNVQRV